MFIKKFVMSALLAAFSFTAVAATDSDAANTSVQPLSADSSYAEHYHGGGGGYWGPIADCRYYNRDGISCGQVGYFEGQVGTPWGFDAGQFRCINGCLQWLGGNYNVNSCYALNRDGITCGQVGYFDGQIGAPWGRQFGMFRCTGGCLQFVGY